MPRASSTVLLALPPSAVEGSATRVVLAATGRVVYR